jgi:cobalt/nickel transport system permease protein
LNEVFYRTARAVVDLVEEHLITSDVSQSRGFLQRTEARIKLMSMLLLTVISAFTTSITVLAFLFMNALALSVVSHIPLRRYLLRLTMFPIISFIIVLPQIFIMPGTPLLSLLGLHVSLEGVFYVAMFTFRVATALSFISLLTLTTSFSSIIFSLRWFKVPTVFVDLLATTYRYILLLINELSDLLLAHESRTLRRPSLRELWKNGGRVVGAFLIRTIERGENVQMAAFSRGYNGAIKTYSPKPRFATCEALLTTQLLIIILVTLWWIH